MWNVLLGGVTGLLGNAITSFTKYKTTKMDNEHKQQMVQLETAAMIKESEMQIQVTKARIEGEVELADAAAFDTSQRVGSTKLFDDKWINMIKQAGSKSKWFGWLYNLIGMSIASGFALVDWLNSFMRPALTLYLMGVTTYITYLSWIIIQANGLETLTTEQSVGIFEQVTSTVIYLTVSAVTWWYGDRSTSKFLQELGKKKNI